jgi:hypothetical protein
MTFEVRKGNTTARSVWTNSVPNTFRKQAGWAKLQETRATAAKHWTERVWYRHNQRWLQSSREGTEASKRGSFKDEQEWGKKCFEDLDQRRMGRPVYMEYGLLREGSNREEIGKWLKNKSIPWQRRRGVAPGSDWHVPCGQQMLKYGYKRTAACTLCQKAHEESGSSWNGELPKVTIGHIQSAGCLGQKEVVTAAHNACIRELLLEMLLLGVLPLLWNHERDMASHEPQNVPSSSSSTSLRLPRINPTAATVRRIQSFNESPPLPLCCCCCFSSSSSLAPPLVSPCDTRAGGEWGNGFRFLCWARDPNGSAICQRVVPTHQYSLPPPPPPPPTATTTPPPTTPNPPPPQ